MSLLLEGCGRQVIGTLTLLGSIYTRAGEAAVEVLDRVGLLPQPVLPPARSVSLWSSFPKRENSAYRVLRRLRLVLQARRGPGLRPSGEEGCFGSFPRANWRSL